MKKNTIFRGLFFMTNFILAGQLQAQDLPDSLLLIRQGALGNALTATRNPVWLATQALPDFGEAGIHYHQENGRFRRPQQALKAERMGFGATGVKRYQNWRFQGEFSYQRLADDSLNYSYAARPFSGNPFISADLSGGNWKGDRLKSALQILAPVTGRWAVATGIDYEAEQSARQNEPRPLYRYMNYRINPALAYHVNSLSQISVSAAISGVNEVVEIGAYSRNNPLLYTLRGYGFATASPVVTAERLTRGTSQEAGLDYRYAKETDVMILSAMYGLRKEEVTDGYADLPIGTLDENYFSAVAGFERDQKRSGWSVLGKGWFRNGTGYDESQQAVNPSYFLSGFGGRISWWKHGNRNNLFMLQLNPEIHYSNFFEEVAETELSTLMSGLSLSVSYRRHFSTAFSLIATPILGYHRNLSGALSIAAPQLMSEILTRPDYLYLSSNYMNAGLSAIADLKIDQQHYRVGLGYAMSTPVAYSNSNFYRQTQRNQFHLTCTVLF